ncbi:MotA/TolQ/ExbB proton channel family protein [Calycomorphotria hydatis]|uniref:MotA/TolQ/ExbB proton channel family protein n=1 Tax=Calycomorphotria hydatis TaxID=2528027 RepID=A0A517TAK0_9PLAN|nr:MotA/TolQ/ExbB proton channel family protein [Calycomorphotria hydatis]QDT65399.1 MotA/TolQ/ExbB proton channel family protein [Calycomorphotria hydatis]
MDKTGSTGKSSPSKAAKAGTSVIKKRQKGFDIVPLAVGLALTVAFYAIIPSSPVYREFLVRYFCGHPLEYITAGLFFIGLAILGTKQLSLRGENTAFRIVARRVDDSRETTRGIDLVQKLQGSLPSWAEQTRIASRLRDTAEFLTSHTETTGVASHMKYLAELAAERMHGSFAFLRTITWAVPILGFLGTVMGITIAIANINPEQLSTSLGDVTGGLAVAFDTTALALGLSLALVFASFVTERSEQSLLDEIEEFGIAITARISDEAQNKPQSMMDVQFSAAGEFAEEWSQLLHQQATIWSEAMQAQRDQWIATVEEQQAALAEQLQIASKQTLNQHHASLQEVRHDLLNTVEQTSSKLIEAVEKTSVDTSDRQERYLAQIELFWTGFRDELREARTSLQQQYSVLDKQNEQLATLMAEEAELSRLQQTLTHNLEALQAGETFEQSLNSLTAAVHLLTAKAGTRAA